MVQTTELTSLWWLQFGRVLLILAYKPYMLDGVVCLAQANYLENTLNSRVQIYFKIKLLRLYFDKYECCRPNVS